MRGDPRHGEQEEATSRNTAPYVRCVRVAGDRHHHIQSQQMDILRVQLQIPAASVSPPHADGDRGGLRTDQVQGDPAQRRRRAGFNHQRQVQSIPAEFDILCQYRVWQRGTQLCAAVVRADDLHHNAAVHSGHFHADPRKAAPHPEVHRDDAHLPRGVVQHYGRGPVRPDRLPVCVRRHYVKRRKNHSTKYVFLSYNYGRITNDQI